jgi:hypothetical protein
MSPNGFGQIWHKTRRGIHFTYTPIKAFMQASHDAKLALKDTFTEGILKFANRRICHVGFTAHPKLPGYGTMKTSVFYHSL